MVHMQECNEQEQEGLAEEGKKECHAARVRSHASVTDAVLLLHYKSRGTPEVSDMRTALYFH